MKNMNNQKLPMGGGTLSLQLNSWKEICALFVILFTMCCLFAPHAYAADIASGTAGTCSWVIDGNGVLTIRPTNGSSGTLSYVYKGWDSYSDKIKKVVVRSGVCCDNCIELFSGLTECTEMNLSNLDTSASECQSMSCMFWNCKKLSNLTLGGSFSTRNIRDMYGMFAWCPSLTTLDLSCFDTRNVKRFTGMFMHDTGLTSVNVSSFNTSQATAIGSMFYECAVTSLDLSSFNTSNVTDMSYMFQKCNSLVELNISGFVVSGSPNMNKMFDSCSSLQSIKLGEQFKFVGSDSVLPTPPTTDPYTGKWIKEDRTAGPLTSAELRDQYTANAGEWSGTWIWEVPPTTYRIAFSIPNDVSGDMAAQEVEPDQTYTLEKQGLYKFGYAFKHWQVGGSATTYQDRATIPANTYTAGTTVTLIPIFEAIDTTLTMANGEMDFYLYGNEKATFDNLPAGTAYEVWEETPSGWRLVSQSNVSGTIEPLQTSTASFVNEYAPGTVTATICGSKILDGKATPAGAYQFQLLENGSIIQTVFNQAGGFIAFDPITYTEVGNHTYTVREVNGGNSGIQYDNHAETITVGVTLDADGILQASVTYDSDGIIFVNTTRPGVLEIIKQAIGITQANTDSEFTFNVILQNNNDILTDGGQYNWYTE